MIFSPVRRTAQQTVIAFWLVSLSIQSCQTLQKPAPERVPLIVESEFSICSGTDGASNLQIYSDDLLRGSGDLEWASNQAGWQMELVNPIGQTLLITKYKENPNHIEVIGILAQNLPVVTSDKDGFVRIDGYFVGIKSNEIPCLLGFKWPTQWLLSRKSLLTSGAKTEIKTEDEFREISLSIDTEESRKENKSCALISWRRFPWIFRSEVRICYNSIKPESGSIEGFEDYSLRWVNLDSP